MMRKYMVVILAFMVTPGFAAESGESPWTGKAEAGVLMTSGNSDTQNVNGKFAVGYSEGRWTHNFKSAVVRTSEDDLTTGERYGASFKTDYHFTKNDYLFGLIGFEQDHFGGIRERLSATVGYGRRLLSLDAHRLDVEIGGGIRRQTTQEPELAETDDGIVRGGLDYLWKISDTASFNQTVNVESGEENTYTESESALKLQVNGNLATSLSYTVKNNSDVPVGTEKTDTITAVNLVYSFLGD